MLCFVLLCYVMFYVRLCYVMFCCVMLCLLLGGSRNKLDGLFLGGRGEGADTCVTFCYANYRTKEHVTGYCMSRHVATVARIDTCLENVIAIL